MDKYKVGNFIPSLRKEKSISQGQLGLLLGVTNKAISKWENGNNQPEVEMLYRLSEVLGVSVDELVHGERENKGKQEAKAEEENKLLHRRIEQAERTKAQEDRKYFFVVVYLLSVVSIFFLLVYVSMYPFLNLSPDPIGNVFLGLLTYFLAPALVLASTVTGLRLLSFTIHSTNPVISIVLLAFFPVSIPLYLVLGFIFLIPTLHKAGKSGFNGK